MSFFGKFKASSSSNANSAVAKKDLHTSQATPLEKHLADIVGPVRSDGSDKFFGFENYGSTCYCNSIIQCLYYSAPFRENVIHFPSTVLLDETRRNEPNGAPLSPRITSTTPYPNPTSPARKQHAPTSPGPGGPKIEESKDAPEYRKRMALQAGPVLDMTRDNSVQYGMDESLFTSLRDIFDAIIGNQSRIGVVSPHRFLEILRRENEMFRSAMHQDAHEFLNLLLNQVVDNVEAFAKQHPSLQASPTNGILPQQNPASHATSALDSLNVPQAGLDTHWVQDIFEGLLTSETRCLTCETTSQRDEAFLDLSVDLSAHTSVTSCLRKFSEEEMLCERNKFHCDNCAGLQEAEKRMKIKRLPRILALHLKRFKYTEDLQRLQKLFHRVVYPFHLRLFNTTDDADDADRLYELYAVVVHIGGGPYHGHYVSIIKTQDRGWLLFDDELVEPVDKSYVMNFFGGEPVPGVQDAKQLACAYVLFYQETTLEAVVKEQEAEAGEPLLPVRTSDAETAKDQLSPVKTNDDGLHLAPTIPPLTQLTGEETDRSLDLLAHAHTTAVTLDDEHVRADPILPTQPLSPALPIKSKKERKQEEKDRKAARKAEEKALDEQRREASAKRVEAWRKQDEQLRQALEASKQSAAEESRERGDDPKQNKEGSSLSRFRSTGMSFRKKSGSLFSSGSREKDKPPALPLESSTSNGSAATDPPAPTATQPHGTGIVSTEAVQVPAAPAPAAAGEEEKPKKHRFSLGRKKSTLV